MFLIYIPSDYLLPYLLSLLLSKFFCSPVLHLIRYISFVDASRDVLWLCEPCQSCYSVLSPTKPYFLQCRILFKFQKEYHRSLMLTIRVKDFSKRFETIVSKELYNTLYRKSVSKKTRDCRLMGFFEDGFLENVAKFTGKHLSRSRFFNTLRAL